MILNSPGTGEFPAQMPSNAENVSIDDVIMICVISTGTKSQKTQQNFKVVWMCWTSNLFSEFC